MSARWTRPSTRSIKGKIGERQEGLQPGDTPNLVRFARTLLPRCTRVRQREKDPKTRNNPQAQHPTHLVARTHACSPPVRAVQRTCTCLSRALSLVLAPSQLAERRYTC
jgi:hypothetical protein